MPKVIVSGYLSFLDLMCCGMGGALLLFLLVSAAAPIREASKPTKPIMIVRCFPQPGSKSRPEMQMQVKPPGRTTWIAASRFAAEKRLDGGAVFYFASTVAPQDGGDCVLVITNPQEGEWGFRAWIVTREGQSDVAPVRIDFLVEGEGVTRTDDDRSQTPIWPGDFTPMTRIAVSSPEK